MYLWRKTAGIQWVKTHEEFLQARADGHLVIVRRPGRKRLALEIACRSRSEASVLLTTFGGRLEKLPRNWLDRFALDDLKPINIGKRLSILNVGRTSVSRLSRHKGRCQIVVPASTAFGTGRHATTAMSLRLLEELTRRWKPRWSVVDLGTGSGILALAASRLGARRVLGVDIDPTAISTAKSNANLNAIRSVAFQLADVRGWKLPRNTHVITANLYSDLLTEILPKLRRCGWLIFSGILRVQEIDFIRAVRRNKLKIIRIRRRGKWIAILVRSGRLATPQLAGGKVLRSSPTAATVKTNAN